MRSLRILVPAIFLSALFWAPPAQAIVSGTNTTIEAHPFQVRVLVSSGGSTYSCGGSIRDATHVVTAAHCVYINGQLATPTSVTVGYGSALIGSLSSAAVSEVTIPSKYINQDSYDVALLDLAAPLTGYGGSTVDRIPPASASTLATGVASQSPAVATGWGATYFDGPGSSTLKQVPLPLRADNVCSGTYGYYVGERTVCAGGLGTDPADNPDTCQGDSGGPLALDSGAGPELVGITSYGYECGHPGIPAAYTEPSDDEIAAVIAGTSSSVYRGSVGLPAPTAPAPAPAATTPVAETVAPPPPIAAFRDTVRPRARVSYVKCKRTRCAFRIAARDSGGRVAKLSVRVARRVRVCALRDGDRVCKYVTRTRKLKPRRIRSGFSVKARLVRSRYKMTAVATDTSGNRSYRATRRFRVR